MGEGAGAGLPVGSWGEANDRGHPQAPPGPNVGGPEGGAAEGSGAGGGAGAKLREEAPPHLSEASVPSLREGREGTPSERFFPQPCATSQPRSEPPQQDQPAGPCEASSPPPGRPWERRSCRFSKSPPPPGLLSNTPLRRPARAWLPPPSTRALAHTALPCMSWFGNPRSSPVSQLPGPQRPAGPHPCCSAHRPPGPREDPRRPARVPRGAEGPPALPESH